jgi:hypothetical protein
MSDQDAMTVLVRGKLESMKELSGLLKRRGIASEIRKPDAKDCGSS